MSEKSKQMQKIIMAVILIGGLLLISKVLAEYSLEKSGFAFQSTEGEEQSANTSQEEYKEVLPSDENADEKTEFQGIKLVIDPGHGGDDPGKIGVNGQKEKDINLSVSLLLKEKLESVGFEVVMTREKDEGLYSKGSSFKKTEDLNKRLEILGSEGTVLGISVHQNSYSDKGVKGPQVFYYVSSKEGEEAAEIIQNTLNEELEITRPRVHKANSSYYLLKKTSVPTVIAECGFLSNPEEAEKLSDSVYREKVTTALFNGIVTYIRKWKADKEVFLFIS